MLKKLFRTANDPVLAVERLVVGIVFFAHGAQKVLGWFGGFGFSATLGFFTHQMGIPAPLVVLAMAIEFLGGIGLILGLLSRVAALGIFAEMLVVIFMVHLRNGFFMNWSGAQKGEGIEYHLLVLALTLALIIRGSGALSVDRALGGSSE